jgi:hypothetical protein
VKYLKADAANGQAATAHGLVRDPEGNFWFDVNRAGARSASSTRPLKKLRSIKRRKGCRRSAAQ